MQKTGTPLVNWQAGTCMQGGAGGQDLPPQDDRSVHHGSKIGALDTPFSTVPSGSELVAGVSAHMEPPVHDVHSEGVPAARCDNRNRCLRDVGLRSSVAERLAPTGMGRTMGGQIHSSQRTDSHSTCMCLMGKQWQYKRVCVKCDNMSVVQVIAGLSSRDPLLMHLLRLLYFYLALYNIQLRAEHTRCP